jgi:hypothetical protein
MDISDLQKTKIFVFDVTAYNKRMSADTMNLFKQEMIWINQDLTKRINLYNRDLLMKRENAIPTPVCALPNTETFIRKLIYIAKNKITDRFLFYSKEALVSEGWHCVSLATNVNYFEISKQNKDYNVIGNLKTRPNLVFVQIRVHLELSDQGSNEIGCKIGMNIKQYDSQRFFQNTDLIIS